MHKLRFSPQFRARLSEKLMELGNLIAIALVIGQFISEKTFSSATFISGIMITLVCYIISYIVSS